MVVGLTGALVAPVPGDALPQQGTPPTTQPTCNRMNATVTTFHGDDAIPMLHWADNLVFDGHGGMWVSRVLFNQLQRFDASGAMTTTIPIDAPAGLAMGPDGMIYVNQDLIGPTASRIVRFDPTEANPVPTTVATGLPGANGLAIDGDGNLYVGIVGPSTLDRFPSVIKIRPDGSVDEEWTAQADFPNANGIVVSEDRLLVNRGAPLDVPGVEPNSPIEAVPLDDPGRHETIAELSAHAPLTPKALDDLTIGADGFLYTVGFGTGELLRVDLRTGRACVVANGFRLPTSVRVPEAFGDLDPARHLFVTDIFGVIHDVELQPS